MIRVGIITNLQKDINAVKTLEIVNYLLENNIEPILPKEIYSIIELGTIADYDYLFQESNLVMVIGGDGTLLNVARNAARFNTPILGINMGHLGFLTEIETDEICKAIKHINESNYYIEKRMMLEAKVIRKDKVLNTFHALNDVVVSKASLARIIHLEAYINNSFVKSYSADGLIVSSPTGSTAYSLSNGGPIINPTMECILLTPISPHSLDSRSIVTGANDEIRIKVKDDNRDVVITIDGQEGIILECEDMICLRKSIFKTSLIRINDHSFFKLLRDKLIERIK